MSSFLPSTEKVLEARHNPPKDHHIIRSPKPESHRIVNQQHSYHFHINNSTKNTHITITNYKHDPVIVISAGLLGLKKSKRATEEAGYATAQEALNRFMLKFPSVISQASIELICKGFGPGRRGALSMILGPKGYEIQNRVIRITEATPLEIGGCKRSNRRRK